MTETFIRRSAAKGAAWAVPAVALASAAPAATASCNPAAAGIAVYPYINVPTMNSASTQIDLFGTDQPLGNPHLIGTVVPNGNNSSPGANVATNGGGMWASGPVQIQNLTYPLTVDINSLASDYASYSVKDTYGTETNVGYTTTKTNPGGTSNSTTTVVSRTATKL